LTIRSYIYCIPLVCTLLPAFALDQHDAQDGWRKGARVRHPEKLAGMWLVDVHHRIFGLQIVLTTRARKSPQAPGGIIQTGDQAAIEVFEQMGSMRAAGDGDWFDTNSPRVAWTGNHLTIEDPGISGPAINLDLQFDPEAETWSGRFHRGGLDESATLHRPRAAAGGAKSPFAGTWKHEGPINNCLHIVNGQNGELDAWSDDVIAPGALPFPKGSPMPRETVETYGFTAQVQLHSAHNIFLRLKALSAVCCAVDAGGILAQDGTRIRSNVQSEASHNPGSDDWIRVRGDSCLVEAP
jgi:hypothetical protein